MSFSREQDDAGLPSLALARLGARVTGCSDEFFAPAGRIIGQHEPVFVPDKYDEHGKWMDGWETRRRRAREPDHDWLSLELGAPAIVRRVNFCTRHFTGNHPPQARLELAVDKQTGVKEEDWVPLIDRVDLAPDSDNWVGVSGETPWQHLRLSIYPDGGVARLRVHGQFCGDCRAGAMIDLASILSGARIAAFSDAHFGAPINMLMPGPAENMGDGWETARRRGPGHDWALVELGCAGRPATVSVDTSFFKGNYPASFSLRGADLGQSKEPPSMAVCQSWPELVAEAGLEPDQVHEFAAADVGRISHVLLSIHPDGGIARLRVHGRAEP